MTDLPDVLRRLLALAGVAGLLVTPIAIGAQAPNPDVLSVHVGMPRDAARAALEKRMPKGILQLDVQGEVFSLADTDPMNPGVVRVYSTIEPRAGGLDDPANPDLLRAESDDEDSLADGPP